MKEKLQLPPLPVECLAGPQLQIVAAAAGRRRFLKRPAWLASARAGYFSALKNNPRQTLARSSAGQIDAALLTAGPKQRRWILSVLLDNGEGWSADSTH